MNRGVAQSFTNTELEIEKIDGKTIQERIGDKMIALGTKAGVDEVAGGNLQAYGEKVAAMMVECSDPDMEISEDLRDALETMRQTKTTRHT